MTNFGWYYPPGTDLNDSHIAGERSHYRECPALEGDDECRCDGIGDDYQQAAAEYSQEREKDLEFFN